MMRGFIAVFLAVLMAASALAATVSAAVRPLPVKPQATILMTAAQFISKLKDAAAHKTLYVLGCFGAPMTEANKTRYINAQAFNRKPARAAKINAASSDTFGFDCVNLIKGILWGWNGNTNKTFGGAVYSSHGVPDINADGMMGSWCTGVSTNFSGIAAGEAVWKEGHIGVYIGDGQCIECTHGWSDGVQYTNLANIGYTSGNSRTWTKHGKLPWISYDGSAAPAAPALDTSYAGYYRCTTNTTDLKIRSGDSTSYDIVGGIPPGTVVWIDGVTPNNWAKLTYNGATGYSSMDYLGREAPDVDTSYAGYYKCMTNTDPLKIRDSDSTEYGDIIGSIPPGTVVWIDGVTPNNWAKLTYNGVTGYSSMDYLEKVEIALDTSCAGYYKCTTNTDPLKIRSGDSTGYDIIGDIPPATIVWVEGKTPNNWAKLTYGGVTGYSSMDYLAVARHTVTFVDYDGTVLETQSVCHRSSATSPPTASRTGYSFAGWDGSYTDVMEDRTLTATYTANSYTNTIEHWLWGFENGDAATVTDDHNSSNTAVRLDTTYFDATYDSTITLDNSKCVALPNGCRIGQRETAERDTYCSVYGNRNFPYEHLYQSCGLTIEYEYEPVTYTISYTGLEGAANPDNPTTYNVLYGVTLSAPAAREGYTFEGWYSGDTKVTGINEGKTARFTTVQELREGLAARQVGDIALVARWSANTGSGDVNGSGGTDSADYAALKKILKGQLSLESEGVSKEAADMNKDGVISAADCAALALLIRGE